MSGHEWHTGDLAAAEDEEGRQVVLLIYPHETVSLGWLCLLIADTGFGGVTWEPGRFDYWSLAPEEWEPIE